MPLRNWAYLCLQTYCIANIQGNTYAAYERIIRLHLGRLGDMPIGRITSLIIQKHITGSSLLADENGLSENHLTRIRTFLHMIFKYAIQNNLIKYNPTTGIRIPKTGIFENRALTKEEAERLIQVARNSDCLIMFSVILCLYTGLRRGELLGLKWQDVDFTNQTIFVNKQLARWKTENGFIHSEDDFVFPSKNNTGIESKPSAVNIRKFCKLQISPTSTSTHYVTPSLLGVWNLA